MGYTRSEGGNASKGDVKTNGINEWEKWGIEARRQRDLELSG